MFNNFKNLPIKEDVKELLEGKLYSGVWEVKGKNHYFKITSEIRHQPVGIYIGEYYEDHKEALKDAVKCAKVYKKLVEEEIYHPETQIGIYKDYDPFFKKDVLSLMVLIPKLEKLPRKGTILEVMKTKIDIFKKKFNLNDTLISWDIYLDCNWGCDKITNQPYYYDLHITPVGPYVESRIPNYKFVLRLAELIGIK